MNYDQLRCFSALGEILNFSRAAEICFLSPSAFSRVIQRCEDELGTKLCVRTNREVRLTEAGRDFLIFARRSLQDWQDFSEGISGSRGELRGDLSIFATVTACYSILPEILTAYRKANPRVNIHLRNGDAADALAMVRDGRVDCAIAPVPGRGVDDLEVAHLTKTPLVFVAPAEGLRLGDHRSEGAAKEIGLQDFPASAAWDRWPLILPERGLARSNIDSWFASRGIEPRVFARVAGNEGILAMASLGLGLGLLPELVVSNSPMAHGLVILPHLDDVPGFDVGVAARKTMARLPNVAAFMKTAGEAYRQTSRRS